MGLPRQGKWSAEDTEKLLQLHGEKGNKWKEIGAALGRHPESCRYKHRELLLGEAERKGKWSAQEEAKLLDLVTNYIEERPVRSLLEWSPDTCCKSYPCLVLESLNST